MLCLTQDLYLFVGFHLDHCFYLLEVERADGLAFNLNVCCPYINNKEHCAQNIETTFFIYSLHWY